MQGRVASTTAAPSAEVTPLQPAKRRITPPALRLTVKK
jgi:hypothetical protein